MKKKLKINKKVKIFKVKKVVNLKGNIIKILSKKDKFFDKLGDIYLSEIKPFQIKAWRCHKKSTQNIFVIYGKCRIVCFFKKKFKKINLSENSLKLVVIPKNCWYGFQNLSHKKVKLLNITNKNYSEKEIIRKEKNSMDYKWLG
jgi:dTDP-4-dehydrorhamnose 3,5-epimerase-like enzyme|tara:strand:+ start:405 stop:836 length:432 start_codon:yes stop_codon:yes gene_type:complete